MRFAVIEYTSKTGRVWRHTPERPNWLAHPQQEIDPTSFGAYVSALRGEHIPLKGLIVGPVQPVSTWRAWWARLHKKITGRWPHYSLEYLRQFQVVLVVHQLSEAGELATFVERVHQELPHIFLFGVPTQPYGILRAATKIDPQAAADFQRFMNACDVMLALTEPTVPWYQQQTTTPVVYAPQPYPVEYAQQFFKSRSSKQPVIMVAGVTQRDNIRLGQTVAVALQQQFPEYTIVVPKVPEYDYDYSALQGARYEIVPFAEWREHLAQLAKYMLVINTDFTATRGRVQTDCAAVGTPSIGADSDGQRDLFPDLPANPHSSVVELVAQGERLLQDAAWYNQVTAHAARRLQYYNYAASAQRLQQLWATYRQSHHDY